jgi:hypothetical protein
MKVQYDGDGGRILLGDKGLPGGHATANQVSVCWNFFFKGASLHVSMQLSHSCLSSDLYRTVRYGTTAYGGECVCARKMNVHCRASFRVFILLIGLHSEGSKTQRPPATPITFFLGTFCTTTWGNKRKKIPLQQYYDF